MDIGLNYRRDDLLVTSGPGPPPRDLVEDRDLKFRRFLPDPSVSGVRSMGPGLSMYSSFVKLYRCDSG